jgi:hypothetical protein
VSSAAATALLDQLRASFKVHIGAGLYHDHEAGCRLWMLTAIAPDGERWTAKAEDHYGAACRLAELMGFELDDG